jgi:DNA polymerase V
MIAMDQINQRFSKAISKAATGFDKTWQSRAGRIFGRYIIEGREVD